LKKNGARFTVNPNENNMDWVDVLPSLRIAFEACTAQTIHDAIAMSSG
jgi:hypothetical protein